MLREQAEEELLEAGSAHLNELLGADWVVESVTAPAAVKDQGADAVFIIRDSSDAKPVTVLVQAKRHLSPAGAQLLAFKLPHHRSESELAALLVVAPFLSARAREVLTEGGVGYLDLTGNVNFRLRRPAVVLHTTGADRNPAPAEEATRRLSGASAGRLVRYLVDVAPPYTPSELAAATGLSLPYVSRLLTVMEDQALLSRAARGKGVVDVDWVPLLRARATETALLRSGRYVPLVAPRGVRVVLERIRDHPHLGERLVVTGSESAAAVAPVAVGGQLMLYTPPGGSLGPEVHKELGLLPLRRRGPGEVLCVQAPDPVVFERTRLVDGVRHVALSQLVLDCLTGPGRMPAEGEAVLQFMVDHEPEWRVPGRAADRGSSVGSD